MHENSVKEEALQALRDYNMAFEKQDIEGQVNFYSAAWRAGTGGREALKAHLHDMREKSALEVKHFALDDAEVSCQVSSPIRQRGEVASPLQKQRHGRSDLFPA